ncbi:pro-resilin-like [Galleria mellonella]|uniref:Pro-resilin-like n=1 Tax=Galleria mellonella TaxID=7137 RepID=A0ABM3MU60_GALME|nr:pro-resilin-like [Galleria mellonella]
MILHILFISALTWATTKCEPPINSYLPPASGNGGGPSTPFGSSGLEHMLSNRLETGGNQNQPQNSYFPPGRTGSSSMLDTQYGPPRGQNFEQGPGSSSQFGSQSQSQGKFQSSNAPNSQYGLPEQAKGPSERSNNQSPSIQSNTRRPIGGSTNNDLNSPSHNRVNSFSSQESEFRPESSYGPPPSGNYMSPNKPSIRGPQGMNIPSFSKSNSGQETFSGKQPVSGPPSSLYGTPNFGPDSGSNHQPISGPPSSSYGTPNFGPGSSSRRPGNQEKLTFDDNQSEEPAKYEFNYEVDDAQTGTKFGHSEQRDGDTATGEYNVELPDGRKQVVEYEAGLQGYKPQIRYEGGRSNAALRSNPDNDRIPQSDNQGYPQAEPEYSFPENNNNFGVSQEIAQNGRPVKYQQASQGKTGLSEQSFMGYPRTRLEENGLDEFPGLEQNKFENKPQFPTGNNNDGLETLNGGSRNGGYPVNEGTRNTGYPKGDPRNSNEGYPRGGPRGNSPSHPRNGSQRNNGNYPQDTNKINNQKGKGGYPFGGPQTNIRGGEGYPSGAPNGPRGSGY